MDIFIIKYDKNGNVVWARSTGSAGEDYYFAIATDNNNNAYITGNYAGNMLVGFDSLMYRGTWSLYIAKYNSTGNAIWAMDANSAGYQAGYVITCSGADNSFYIAGTISAVSAFSYDTINKENYTNYFVAKASETNSTDVSKLQLQPELFLYPNPAKQEINIQLKSNGKSLLAGYNSAGIELYKQQIEKGTEKTTTNIAQFPTGSYYVILYTNNGSIIRP